MAENKNASLSYRERIMDYMFNQKNFTLEELFEGLEANNDKQKNYILSVLDELRDLGLVFNIPRGDSLSLYIVRSNIDS